MKTFFKYTLATILGVMIAWVIIFFISIGIFSAIISAGDKPVQVKNNSVLELNLNAQISDRVPNDPFSNLDLPGMGSYNKLGLNDILKSIKKAETDDRIKGIYITHSNVGAGYATTEEIRNALKHFKTSGKFIYAYSNFYSQKAYYLNSVADSIIVNPEGMIGFTGLSAQLLFFKKLQNKIGVEMQVVRHGKFKAAVEPYLREDMSPENREQNEAYLNSMWDQVLKGVAEERDIDIKKLNKIADNVSLFKDIKLAVEYGLIDGLKYRDQVLDDLKALTGTTSKKGIPTISVSSYVKAPVPGKKLKLHKDKIAVIYAGGAIDAGDGSAGDNQIDSEEVAKAIRKARKDSAYKAIVLRVNSPGGTVIGSDIMWREVVLAKQAKPVIVSFGDVAASGGYYMSCEADTIVANPNTITGSIGIFATIPNAGELLTDKIGVTFDVAKTNENSDFISLIRPMTTFERNVLQHTIEKGYKSFVAKVSNGRKIPKEKFNTIGEGRVWSGEDALEIGLVDVLGGLETAIEIAKEKAGLEECRIVELPKLEDPFQAFMKGLTGNAGMSIFFGSNLKKVMPYYNALENASNMEGVMARMPYELIVE